LTSPSLKIKRKRKIKKKNKTEKKERTKKRKLIINNNNK
jgi:hypothetical protein